MARPEWCQSFDCPNSSGESVCYINSWINRGWSGNRKNTRVIKDSLHKKYSTMTQEKPDELIQECAEKAFDMGIW